MTPDPDAVRRRLRRALVLLVTAAAAVTAVPVFGQGGAATESEVEPPYLPVLSELRSDELLVGASTGADRIDPSKDGLTGDSGAIGTFGFGPDGFAGSGKLALYPTARGLFVPPASADDPEVEQVVAVRETGDDTTPTVRIGPVTTPDGAAPAAPAPPSTDHLTGSWKGNRYFSVAAGDLDGRLDRFGRFRDEAIVTGSLGNAYAWVQDYNRTRGVAVAPTTTPFSRSAGESVAVAVGDLDASGDNEAIAVFSEAGKIRGQLLRYDGRSLKAEGAPLDLGIPDIDGTIPSLEAVTGTFGGGRPELALSYIGAAGQKDVIIGILRFQSKEVDGARAWSVDAVGTAELPRTRSTPQAQFDEVEGAICGYYQRPIARADACADTVARSDYRPRIVAGRFLTQDAAANDDPTRRQLAVAWGEVSAQPPSGGTTTGGVRVDYQTKVAILSAQDSAGSCSTRCPIGVKQESVSNVGPGQEVVAGRAPVIGLAAGGFDDGGTGTGFPLQGIVVSTVKDVILEDRKPLAQQPNTVVQGFRGTTPTGPEQVTSARGPLNLRAYDRLGQTQRLGPPMSVTLRDLVDVDAIIQDPPKHADVINGEIVNVSRNAELFASRGVDTKNVLDTKVVDKADAAFGFDQGLEYSGKFELNAGLAEVGVKLEAKGKATERFSGAADNAVTAKKQSANRDFMKTQDDDAIHGFEQDRAIYRFPVIGGPKEIGGKPAANFLDVTVGLTPRTEETVWATQTTQYRPTYEHGNLLSYPIGAAPMADAGKQRLIAPSATPQSSADCAQKVLATTVGANTPTLAPFGDDSVSPPLFRKRFPVVAGGIVQGSLELEDEAENSCGLTYSKTIGGEESLKATVSAEFQLGVAEGKEKVTAEVGFDQDKTTGSMSESTVGTTLQEEIELESSRPISSGDTNTQYDLDSALYISDRGVQKLVHGVTLSGSWWADTYRRPDPALNMPARIFIDRSDTTLADGFPYFNGDPNHQVIRDATLALPTDPAATQAKGLSRNPRPGEEIRVTVPVHNYSASTQASGATVTLETQKVPDDLCATPAPAVPFGTPVRTDKIDPRKQTTVAVTAPAPKEDGEYRIFVTLKSGDTRETHPLTAEEEEEQQPEGQETELEPMLTSAEGQSCKVPGDTDIRKKPGTKTFTLRKLRNPKTGTDKTEDGKLLAPGQNNQGYVPLEVTEAPDRPANDDATILPDPDDATTGSSGRTAAAPMAGLLGSVLKGLLPGTAEAQTRSEGPRLERGSDEDLLAIGPNRGAMRTDLGKVELGERILLRVNLDGKGGDLAGPHHVRITGGASARSGVGVARIDVPGARDDGGGTDAYVWFRPRELGRQTLRATVTSTEGRYVPEEEGSVKLEVVRPGEPTAIASDDDDAPVWPWVAGGAAVLLLVAGAATVTRRRRVV